MIAYEILKERLARSAFRSRFRLGEKEKCYVARKGFAVIRQQAEEILRARLGAAEIPNDGHQTPMKGHAVFIAQHATGSCCRGCLAKWHAIKQGRALTEEEITSVADVITAWIQEQCAGETILVQPEQLRFFED